MSDDVCQVCDRTSIRGDGWCTNHRPQPKPNGRPRLPDSDHGTARCYWRGCRQQECRAAHAAYERARRLETTPVPVIGIRAA